MNISDLARAAGIGPSAVRWYEAAGVIPPAMRRENGYREYGRQEIDRFERVADVSEETLSFRWTYRYEMRHLLALVGFEDVVEWSDFRGTGPAYGGEQVWQCSQPLQDVR